MNIEERVQGLVARLKQLTSDWLKPSHVVTPLPARENSSLSQEKDKNGFR